MQIDKACLHALLSHPCTCCPFEAQPFLQPGSVLAHALESRHLQHTLAIREQVAGRAGRRRRPLSWSPPAACRAPCMPSWTSAPGPAASARAWPWPRWGCAGIRVCVRLLISSWHALLLGCAGADMHAALEAAAACYPYVRDYVRKISVIMRMSWSCVRGTC